MILLQVAPTPLEGVMMAKEAQESGRAGDTMRKWIDVSNACQQREQAAAAAKAAAS